MCIVGEINLSLSVCLMVYFLGNSIQFKILNLSTGKQNKDNMYLFGQGD